MSPWRAWYRQIHHENIHVLPQAGIVLKGIPVQPRLFYSLSIYCAPPRVSTTVVDAGIIKLNWVRSPILKERQKRKHFTHSWRQEPEGPSLLWEQKVKDRRRPRGNSNLTPVLPVKGTCHNAYQCFPPHQLNGREERARVDILLWWNLSHGNMRTGEKKSLWQWGPGET